MSSQTYKIGVSCAKLSVKLMSVAAIMIFMIKQSRQQTCSTPLVFTLSASGLSAVSRALWVNKYQTTSTNTPNNTILYYNSTSQAVCRGPPVYLQNPKIAIPFQCNYKDESPLGLYNVIYKMDSS